MSDQGNIMEGEDYMNGPKVIKAGKDPDCIHNEYIGTDLIGTCRHCGRVRNYGRSLTGEIEPIRSRAFRAAMLEELQPTEAGQQRKSQSRGGVATAKRNYTRRGSSNPESAQWSRLKRSAREKGEDR